MIIPDGYTEVPAGKIAAVVTLLDMTAAPPPREDPPNDGWELRHMPRPDLDWYRDLFRRVGEEWLWFSRLRLSDEALAEIVQSPDVQVHALWVDGRAEGLLELEFSKDGSICELSFLGLTRRAVGRGAGRWLMNRLLAIAWARPIRKLQLKTCSLDHPSALAFYLRTGFRAYGRQIEVSDDPRLYGLFPRTAGPHVPLIAADDDDNRAADSHRAGDDSERVGHAAGDDAGEHAGEGAADEHLRHD